MVVWLHSPVVLSLAVFSRIGLWNFQVSNAKPSALGSMHFFKDDSGGDEA